MDRSNSSRDRVRKHRAIHKMCETEMMEVLHSIATTSETTSDTKDDVDAQEDSVIGDGDDDDSCQEIALDIQDADTQNESDMSVDDEMHHEMARDTREANTHMPNYQIDAEQTDDVIQAEKTKEDVVEELRNWAIKSSIQHNHLDELLKILRKRLIPSLPKSSKTFLATSSGTSHCIRGMDDAGILNTSGQFVYFGIESSLKRYIHHEVHTGVIELIFNIDGLPISNSSGKCFWPIMCKPHYIPDIYSPFIVAIYFGMSKPKNIDDYLQQFVEEINSLQKDGIMICQKQYEVKLKCFVADTPARAFLKCCKCHGGFSACERCNVYGRSESTGKGSTVTYPGVDHQERTNASFRQKRDPEHHTGTSPLLAIEPQLDMPTICLLDMMHLGAGVVKKLIVYWTNGPLKIRLSPSQKQELSRRLLCLQRLVPREFQRKPRSVYEVLKWKATEFRFFVLYCGPIVLKFILPVNLYKHFLLLHVAFRILCSDELAIAQNATAKKCLKKFVLALPLLYGPASLVINMHNLLHLADDAKNMGCSLSRINCFPFESALGALKKKLRTPNKPLAQICRRYHKQNSLQRQKVLLPPVLDVLNSFEENIGTIVNSLRYRSMFLSCTIPNNMVLLKDGVIMKIDKILNQGIMVSTMTVQGKVWGTKKSMYHYPQESHDLGIWELGKSSSDCAIYLLSDVKQKLVRLRLSLRRNGPKRLFVASLLHS